MSYAKDGSVEGVVVPAKVLFGKTGCLVIQLSEKSWKGLGFPESRDYDTYTTRVTVKRRAK